MTRAWALLGIVTSFCWAQTRDTAAVFGAVQDPQGAAIQGATVTLKSPETGRHSFGSKHSMC